MTTPNTIQFEGGDVLANLEDRTITGLLIPFGEEGRTNIGRFTVEAGAITIPADPTIVGLNTDHERSAVVGRATKLEERADGIYATLTLANTPEGDAALADAINPTGKRRKLSAEFGPAIIKAGKLVAGHARLWGSALVEAGAFPSAQVLAADTPPAPNADHLDLAVDVLPADITATTPAGDTATYEPTATPAQETPAPPTEGASTVTATVLAGATVPATVPTTMPGAPTAPTVIERGPDLQQIFAAIAAVRSNPHGATEAMQVLAALSDIKISGSGALPGTGVLQPNWLGQMNQGIPYVREYITLGKLGSSISAAGKKGFKVGRGTSGSPADSFDGEWAGNKAAINSYTGFSTAYSSTLRKFAIAEDIAREFYDLPGGAEIVQAFMELIFEDHARWSDEAALADWVTAAGTLVAPATYPGVDGHDYAGAMGQLIQGVVAVKRRKADGRRDVPTFAIANDAAYEEMLYTPKDLIPEFVTFDLNTDGNGTADGKIRIVNGDTGIVDTASVIVGADYAIEFDELAGGPLTVDALDIAKGGIDKAVHGYLQTFVVRSEAVVHVGVADV